MSEEIQQRVLQVVRSNHPAPPERVRGDATFDELRIDSLDAINLLFVIEEEFDVRFTDDEARGLRCLDDVVRLISERRNVRPDTAT